eukprot:m.696613 g.696613  ORF g.696613 m.696613 type:complete len:228 (-) comp58673_c0_seq59:116-799(-)
MSKMFTQDDVAVLCRYTDENELKICQELVLKYGPAIITAECDAWRGDTAFHLAATNHRLPLLIWFLQQGVDVNAFNRWGRTALMMAAFWDDLACAKTLLGVGADASLKSKDGKTALQIAREMNGLATVTLLEDHERLLAQQNIKPAVRHNAPQAAEVTPDEIVEPGRILWLNEGAVEEVMAGPDHEQSPIQSAQSAAEAQKFPEQEPPVPTAVMNLALTDLDLNLHE